VLGQAGPDTDGHGNCCAHRRRPDDHAGAAPPRRPGPLPGHAPLRNP
jgi:hypothetical protein